MIRDKSFAPDGRRSQFFPMTPQPGAAPAFPPTPVFQACAPKTPVATLAQPFESPEPQLGAESQVLEVKEEVSDADVVSGEIVSR